MQSQDHVDMDCNDKWVIEKLYWQRMATVRFGDQYPEYFTIGKAKTVQLIYSKDLQ